MPLLVLISLLFISGWFFSEILVLVPIELLAYLQSLLKWGVLAIACLIVIWCFGE
jgi:hypothetical protein